MSIDIGFHVKDEKDLISYEVGMWGGENAVVQTLREIGKEKGIKFYNSAQFVLNKNDLEFLVSTIKEQVEKERYAKFIEMMESLMEKYDSLIVDIW